MTFLHFEEVLPLQELLDAFKQWLTEEGKASKTIESYVGDIEGFQKYLTEKAVDTTQPLSRFAFVRYKQYLIDENFAVATINKKINSLKVYNDFLLIKGLVKERYIHLKRDRIKVAAGSEQVVSALSEEQVEKLLFYLEDHTKVSQRNKLIAYLLLYTGVRVSELVNIKLGDIDYLTSSLTVRGKGGKIREISLREDVVYLIRSYVKGERLKSKFKDSEYLLLSQRAPKVHRDAVRNWLANVSKDLGFKLHPHLFRHTFCTRLLKKGVDLTTVSKLAGHSSVNMTARFYIQTTRQEKMDAVKLL
ncbi:MULTISPECIES: tyrosine-type recombinase/integrase [unclassified Geobacillus]|uniref:tyrosine-type recombinase/integrase n=1 Tax=unclassified Geobacillus TaxID=2642459 RepID=UPI000C288D1A|nr:MULTISPECIES: tyrosine-type recombinase/integrase [unclassified Geobacillus]PJW13133.1 integrase [Geobacillus sp. Manikaran-105]PJW16155.1 integrase [Geobacillus sp. WSUCF-018B]